MKELTANELRIGNKFECMGMIQTVFELCDNTDRGRIKQVGYEYIIRCEENGNQYKPIEINSIPLTEEWLLKFGFEIVNNEYFESKTKQYRLGNRLIVLRDGVFCDYGTGRKLEYVHILQNLWFILEEKELQLIS
jgi:hypothetical protein